MLSDRRYTRFLLPCVLLGALVAVAAPARSATQAPARVLVAFRADASPAARAAALARAGGALEGRVRDLGVQVVTVPHSRAADALAELKASSAIAYAEPDLSARAFDVTPNDYWWPNEWSQVKVGAPKAWAISTGSASTIVAILDTGVDPAQPDLQGAFVPGWNALANTADTTDTNGHGTDVAGVALARSNNGIGIASYCWTCSLMPVKVLDSNAGTISSVSNGITWATDHGARVISMSLGFTTSSATLQNAVQYAYSHNVVIVAAAGNYGTSSPVYPAAYPQVLGVAGSDANDQLYSWSSYGSWAKLAAPGCNFATGTNAWYGTFCGTSSAAPALAGIAALAVACAPTATNAQIDQALETSAVSIGPAVQYGRVNAYGALAALGCGGATSSATSPVNTSLPAISGTPQDGQTLAATQGAWTGTAPMSYAYQWRRCDSSGASCAPIGGANAATYAVASADVGFTLSVAVTVANVAGSAVAASPATPAVTSAPAPPSGGTTSPTTVSATFSGSLNKGQSSRAYKVSVGSGNAAAALSFTKASSLTLTVTGPDGTPVGSASGASILALTSSLAAGTYTYVVGGAGGNASYTLTLTYPNP